LNHSVNHTELHG